jgi:hypothetical protein
MFEQAAHRIDSRADEAVLRPDLLDDDACELAIGVSFSAKKAMYYGFCAGA